MIMMMLPIVDLLLRHLDLDRHSQGQSEIVLMVVMTVAVDDDEDDDDDEEEDDFVSSGDHQALWYPHR